MGENVPYTSYLQVSQKEHSFTKKHNYCNDLKPLKKQNVFCVQVQGVKF
jgi:hypothetical protein